MRFFNFNTDEEIGCITKAQFAYLVNLEKEHLAGTLDTYSLKRNDIGVVLISDKFEQKTVGLSARKQSVNMMALIIPSNEYKGKTKIMLLSEVSKGYPRVIEYGYRHSADEAVKEMCACYKATNMVELEGKRRAYLEDAKNGNEM